MGGIWYRGLLFVNILWKEYIGTILERVCLMHDFTNKMGQIILKWDTDVFINFQSTIFLNENRKSSPLPMKSRRFGPMKL